MDRRKFLKRFGLASAALASAPAIIGSLSENAVNKIRFGDGDTYMYEGHKGDLYMDSRGEVFYYDGYKLINTRVDRPEHTIPPIIHIGNAATEYISG